MSSRPTRRTRRKREHGGEREGAGRPAAGRVAFNIRVKLATAALIDRLCFQRTLSRGEIVEEWFASND